MALNIITSQEDIKVDTLNILIYGQPGAGKSSIGFTAKKPLSLDFDKGSHRSAYRKDIVPIKSWQDIAVIQPSDLENYDTIVVDTVGRALDFLTQSIIAENAKNGTRNGGLTMQGWGILKTQFTNWVKQLNLLGKDVIFIAHDKEDKSGDTKFIRPDVAGGSYNELMKVADFIGYYFMETNKRVIDFNPCEAYIGKNSANFEKLFVPNFNQSPDYLASIIQKMKDTLNNRNQENKEIVNLITNLKNQLNIITDAQGINLFAQNMASAGLTNGVKATIKQLFVTKVNELGLVIDPNSKMYYSPKLSAKEVIFEEQPESLSANLGVEEWH